MTGYGIPQLGKWDKGVALYGDGAYWEVYYCLKLTLNPTFKEFSAKTKAWPA